MIERLDALLEDYGSLGAYGREDQTSNHFITNEIAELKVTGTFVPGVFPGVTVFLLHLVLSRLVATQREQIAVLKAFGYGNFTIGWHYLKLAYAALIGGVLLGVAVGWWFRYSITALYTEFFRFPVLRYEAGATVSNVDSRIAQPGFGQRVNVIADFVDDTGGLGDGYRIEARLVVWESENVLRVPASALYRKGQDWRVFVVENDQAREHQVEIGHRTAFDVEVLHGLDKGIEVIVHPNNQIANGARVTTR